MLYCISDLHGEYEKYRTILEKIHLQATDTLYVLGDVCDRGSEPCGILLDMMVRPNVVFLMGNHDATAAQVLSFLSQEITDESIEQFDTKMLYLMQAWLADGGASTLEDFRKRSPIERLLILNYLKSASLYEEVRVGGNDYVLVHSGLEHFAPDKKLSDYSPEELLFSRTDYSKPLFSGNRFLVTGHTPTAMIPENPNPGAIFRKNNHIALDCGAAHPDGRLGAICLDTGEEVYSN